MAAPPRFENVCWTEETLDNSGFRRITLESGFTFRCYISGNGRPNVIFFHGFQQFVDTYAPFLRHLEVWYNVIAPDLPGHGFSDLP